MSGKQAKIELIHWLLPSISAVHETLRKIQKWLIQNSSNGKKIEIIPACAKYKSKSLESDLYGTGEDNSVRSVMCWFCGKKFLALSIRVFFLETVDSLLGKYNPILVHWTISLQDKQSDHWFSQSCNTFKGFQQFSLWKDVRSWYCCHMNLHEPSHCKRMAYATKSFARCNVFPFYDLEMKCPYLKNP